MFKKGSFFCISGTHLDILFWTLTLKKVNFSFLPTCSYMHITGRGWDFHFNKCWEVEMAWKLISKTVLSKVRCPLNCCLASSAVYAWPLQVGYSFLLSLCQHGQDSIASVAQWSTESSVGLSKLLACLTLPFSRSLSSFPLWPLASPENFRTDPCYPTKPTWGFDIQQGYVLKLESHGVFWHSPMTTIARLCSYNFLSCLLCWWRQEFPHIRMFCLLHSLKRFDFIPQIGK